MRSLRLITFYTVILLFTFFLSTYTLSYFDPNKTSSSELLSPVLPTSEPAVKSFNDSIALGLEEHVNEALKGSKGKYSVVIRDLTTGQTFSREPERIYQTASLYKLWTMAVVYEQIKSGDLEKEQTLSSTVEELNKKFDIATESAELTDGEISLSVEEALEKMITVSDNYSALLLTAQIRVSKIKSFLEEKGFTKSNIGQPPKSTASDIADFLEKLYLGKLADKTHTEEMLNLLKQQKLNDRIPKYLPEEIEVAHKTGELEGAKHDAGIIYTDKGNYILVVLSDSDNPEVAAERIANLSLNIYNFLTETK